MPHVSRRNMNGSTLHHTFSDGSSRGGFLKHLSFGRSSRVGHGVVLPVQLVQCRHVLCEGRLLIDGFIQVSGGVSLS